MLVSHPILTISPLGTAFRILLFLGITSVPRNYGGLITETPPTNNDVNVFDKNLHRQLKWTQTRMR